MNNFLCLRDEDWITNMRKFLSVNHKNYTTKPWLMLY